LNSDQALIITQEVKRGTQVYDAYGVYL